MSAEAKIFPRIADWHGYPILGMGPWKHTGKSVPSEPGWYVSVLHDDARYSSTQWRMRWWNGSAFSVSASPLASPDAAAQVSSLSLGHLTKTIGFHWRKLIA